MRLLFILLMLFCRTALANSPCDNVPNDVQVSLRLESGWSILETTDLIEEDRALWEQFHPGQCPGIAVLNFDGRGENGYALALVQFGNGRDREKLVLFTRKDGQLSKRVLVPPSNILYTNVAAPFVVWRAPPGIYHDLKTDRQIKLLHDGVVYERMEATATLFYFMHGQFKSILTSE